ncbi:MAG: PLP-dependent aminotransferase family protein, partial [Verrucomicrobiota bacterium]
EELRKHILVLRGITAKPDEVIVTTGAQQGLHLVIELMIRPGMVVGLEDPCNPELRYLVKRRGAKCVFFGVDAQGVQVDPEQFARCDLVFISPVCQRPMGVTLSSERRQEILELSRRHDVVLVEDDYQWEIVRGEREPPALRGTAGGESVIYTATLAQPISASIRLGVMVAPAQLIRAARGFRRITSRPPPLSIQRIFMHLLANGSYSSAMRRMENEFIARINSLHDALNHYLPTKVSVQPARLGAGAWIAGPQGLDTNHLAESVSAKGVLIESASPYFSSPSHQNVFRLGITGIQSEQIREGVAIVAKAIVALTSDQTAETLGEPPRYLTADAIRQACAGSTLLCKTVYGEPCTIHLAENGQMTGHAGYANEDRDTGRWWIEDNYWCRQWQDWAYGEVARFQVVTKENEIQWYLPGDRLIDRAVLVQHSD